ncbi:MAG: hypothetical protein Q9183_002816, partial [Haloplaca sp. 2 TL-2023]
MPDQDPITAVPCHEKSENLENSTDDPRVHPPTTPNEHVQHLGTRKKAKGILRTLGKQETNNSIEQSGQTNPHMYSFANQFRATILRSWLNLLLVFSPIGIAVNYAHVTPIAVFIINLIAIMPLAGMLGYASEEIALRAGETLGGLVNASFGNAVELIISIIALVHNEIDIVRESLIGSILSNLLLVFGECVFFGGVTRDRQHFNMKVAQREKVISSLPPMSILRQVLIQVTADTDGGPDVTALSRGVSILLLIVYGCFLFFQLKTHRAIYTTPSQKVLKRSETRKLNRTITREATATSTPHPFRNIDTPATDTPQPRNSMEHSDRTVTTVDHPEPTDHQQALEIEPTESPKLLKSVAILTLLTSTALVALCAEAMVGSIDAITSSGAVSRTFVGLILLPIVGNAAEHATAVRVAIKDKMDLSIGICLGSSMQISLLIIPFIVVLGWILGKGEMDLAFDGFQVIALFLAVILVNYLIQDGESH